MRFLNSTGGGRITKTEGRIAYVVDDDGFETPVLMNELVVVAPAESQTAKVAAADPAATESTPPTSAPRSPMAAPAEAEPEIIEVPGGDRLNIVLAYEARDLKQLSTTSFDAYLVNDSNYFLAFNYLISTDGKEWTTACETVIEPNTQALVDEIDRQRLSEMTYVAVQFIAYKRSRTFSRKLPVWYEQKLDMTKFFKLHCFKDNVYFESPVIAIDVMLDDRLRQTPEVNVADIRNAMMEKKDAERPTRRPVTRRRKSRENDGVLEVDLHIDELLDNTKGMSHADILNYQIDHFRKVMDSNLNNHGRRIVFIHGKGEGVLRQALAKELNHRYKGHDVQDASFREYGFGATQVTIR